MTLAVLVAIAIVAAPVVLLISTAGCATIAGIELPPIRHADYGKYGDDVLSTPGLEGYWRLGEKNSVLTAPTPPEPTAVNTLQPVHDGTYKNTGPTALKDSIQLEQKGPLYYDTDTAAFFVGDGGYVEVPSLGTFIEIAIEVWAKLADAQPNWRVVVGCYEPKNATDTIQTGYRIRIRTDPSDSEIVQVEGAVGGLNIPLPIQSLRGKTIWHHIVLSANGQHAELYLDENPAKPADGQFELTPTLTATPCASEPIKPIRPPHIAAISMRSRYMDNSSTAKSWSAIGRQPCRYFTTCLPKQICKTGQRAHRPPAPRRRPCCFASSAL